MIFQARAIKLLCHLIWSKARGYQMSTFLKIGQKYKLVFLKFKITKIFCSNFML
jgi:hypothetical protein